MSLNLSEITRTLVLNQIKSGIKNSLANIRVDRNDAIVGTEDVKEYFIFDPAAAFRCPSIFVIVDRFDFMLDRGANHTNAMCGINVNAVVEERDKTRLTIKCERYQTALHDLLHRKQLISADNTLKIIVKVMSAEFSPIYTVAQEKENPQGFFRKEVYLRLEIEHYEL